MRKKKTPKPTPPSSLTGPQDWGTPAARVKWLVQTRFQGNRSAFAGAVGVSHTIIAKVASGQPPGRKLLTNIAEHLRVNPTWLLTGNGEPYLEPHDLGGQSGLPASRKLLPGPPFDHQNLLTDGWIDLSGQLFFSSQYWLILVSDQPILREPFLGFRCSDQLLFETDRTRFPRERSLIQSLCIIRFSGNEPQLKLGAVTYIEAAEGEPERLEADTFDLSPDPENVIWEHVYRHYPDGNVGHHKRPLKLIKFREHMRPVPLAEEDHEPALPTIKYGDIVAVWLKILRRPMV